MGRQVRIAELARNMIRLSGLTEDQIRIEFTGLRPGEKLYEETIDAAEPLLPTPHPKLHVAQACNVDESLLADVVRIVESGPPLSDRAVARVADALGAGISTRGHEGA